MIKSNFSGGSYYPLMSIPGYFTKLYVEYKIIDPVFKSPIDDQLVLEGNTGSARYLFYDCYSGWDARTIFYNGSESQITRRGATWPGSGIIGMAIDYTVNVVSFYYDNNLFGSVNINDTFRTVYVNGGGGHLLNVEQRLTRSDCLYPKDGFPTYVEALNIHAMAKDFKDLPYWYL